jgi:hypothetical protein
VLKDLQAILLAACRQPDPADYLAQVLAHAGDSLSDGERGMLRAASADGLRLTYVLVAKLRLERLLRGDPAAAAAARDSPAAFMQRFQRYCDAVAPAAVFPSEEAAAFAAFEREQRG